MMRSCRPVSADFCLLVLTACFAAAVQAADVPAAVTPPKPVVLQPTAVMAPPPPAVEDVQTPVAKAKTAKKRKSVKAAVKPKPKAKRR